MAMPVEIREIVIRTTLETSSAAQRATAEARPEMLREELLEACARLIREARHTHRRER
jgi:Family of unknown function (DUF5908)